MIPNLKQLIADLELAAVAALSSFSAALTLGIDSTKSLEAAGIAAAVAGVYAFAKATGVATLKVPSPVAKADLLRELLAAAPTPPSPALSVTKVVPQ